MSRLLADNLWHYASAKIVLLCCKCNNIYQSRLDSTEPTNCQDFRAEPPKNPADLINLPASFGWGHIANAVNNPTMLSATHNWLEMRKKEEE